MLAKTRCAMSLCLWSLSLCPSYGSEADTASQSVFRNIFAGFLEEEGYSVDQMNTFAFKAPEAFLKEPKAKGPEDFLGQLRSLYSRGRSEQFYAQGRGEGLIPTETPVPVKPVTIVVVPGIFGEFIQETPFQEILGNPHSAYKDRWGAALKGVGDLAYSLNIRTTEAKSLGELMPIGSADRDGEPMVNLVLLRPLPGSLETLGSLSSNIETYQRRLAKFFNTVDDGTDVYFMGYSRGLPVALELVASSAAEPQKNPWMKRVKGVIGLGGVFYGTDVAADALTNTKSPTGKALAVMTKLAADLQDRPNSKNPITIAKVVATNTSLWTAALKELGAVAMAPDPLGLTLSNLEHDYRSKQNNLADPSALGMFSLVTSFVTENFQPTHAFTDYFDNVASFKILITKVHDGISSLTPENRLAWWRSHNLPKDLKIFSLVGSMPDAYSADNLSPLFSFDGYGGLMVDFNRVLRPSFYDVLKAENQNLNDSQVSMYASRYWASAFPEKALEHHYLGVLGTHHWGMAFPYAFRDDYGVNHFPRTAMMKSIAAYIATLE